MGRIRQGRLRQGRAPATGAVSSVATPGPHSATSGHGRRGCLRLAPRERSSPRARGSAPGETFLSPDDAFFTPTGTDILATEETDRVVSRLGVAGQRLLWRYGTPGVAGSGPDQLSNPDDAMMRPNGDVLVADIENCSLLLTRTGACTVFPRG